MEDRGDGRNQEDKLQSMNREEKITKIRTLKLLNYLVKMVAD